MNKHITLLIVSCMSFMMYAQTSYYVDNIGGDDNNGGTSELNAFKSLVKVNGLTFEPGDFILFKRGGNWAGTLKPKGSGVSGNRITIGAYGEGSKPIIDGEGVKSVFDYMSAGIILYNQEYWEIRDIEVRNFEQGNPSEPIEKAGILVLGEDVGTLHDFKFENLKISNVNGSLETRENGGIFLNVIRSSTTSQRVPTNFDGVYVNNCHFLDVDRGGFLNQSIWKTRDLTSAFGETCINGKTNDWFPSHNIVVENSKFEEVGGNGLVIRVAEAPLVQNNLFVRCGSKTTGNASYPYNCNNALWQYNEACYTIYNEGDADASGFDSDYYCKNTVIQYNYSHHNEWGGVLICSWSSLENAFNDGTIVRNNVFQDEENHMIRFSGNITNTEVSNNLFVTTAEIDDVMMWNKNWGAKWPDNIEIKENVFYNEGTPDFIRLGSTSNNSLTDNVLFGSEFNDSADFVPGFEDDEENLKTTIDLVREIGERSELLVSEAEQVVNMVWKDENTIVDIPAVDEVAVNEDTYIRGGSHSTINFDGTLMEIKESNSNNLEYIRRVWLKFDLSSYDAVSSAVLHVSGNQSNGSGFTVNVSGSDDDSWKEEDLTWNTEPTATEPIGSFSTNGDVDDIYQDFNVDVTNYIQGQLAGDKTVSLNLWAAESSSGAFKVSEKEGLGIQAYLSIVEMSSLGIQNKVESTFVLYPNPVQDIFVIESPQIQINNVKVFSVNGIQLLNRSNISSNRLIIDASSFQSGIYFVHIENNQGVLNVNKIIKN